MADITSRHATSLRAHTAPLHRPLAKSLCIALALLVVLAPVAAAEKIKILHFNDYHSRVEPDNKYHGYCYQWAEQRGECAGGLARAKTFIQQERNKGEPMLVLNAGDDFIGTLWDHHYKGKASAHFMNQLGIDALALGNHDFDYGPDKLVEYIQQLKFPVLSANMEANGHHIQHHVKPYIIKHVGNTKVGICGVTTQATMSWSHPWPVTFGSTHDAAQKCAQDVRKQGVNIVILLSHSGYNADRFHAQLVPDLDLVIGGHSHAFLWNWDWGPPPAITHQGGYSVRDHVWGDYPTMVHSSIQPGRKIPVVQAGWGARYVGKIYVDFDDQGDLQSFWGMPVLLGDNGSDNPVAKDSYMASDISSWKFW